MAQKLGRQTEWPRVKGEPDAVTLAPDGWQKSNRSVAGPLRFGTANGGGRYGGPSSVGPKGEAVIADYTRETDYGTDMIARDRKIDRKFPSDLISRELRGPGSSSMDYNKSKGERMPE